EGRLLYANSDCACAERSEDGAGCKHGHLSFPVHDASGAHVGVGRVSLPPREDIGAAEAMVRTIFEASRLGVLVVQAPEGADAGYAGRILECNHAYTEITGIAREDLIGRTMVSQLHEDDRDTRQRLIAELYAGGQPVGEMRYRRADGSYVWCMVVPSLTRSPDGQRIYVVQVIDITERLERERELRHHADHDGLTDLLSRRRFMELLEEEIDQLRTAGGQAALMMLDLDNFKYVNDVLGHTVGDALLEVVAAALRTAVRDSDHLARLGGDEFALLLPGTDLEGALRVADKLVLTVAEHGRISTRAGHGEVTASIGITSWDSSVELDAERALKEADRAMYDAKESGSNRVAVYKRERPRRREVSNRGERLRRLRAAVGGGHFVLHAEPIVSLAAGAQDARRYELLLRMRRNGSSPEGEALVAPAAFLPDAERHGLIAEIDEWVLAEAVELLARGGRGGELEGVCVNVSAATVNRPDAARRILERLDAAGVDPAMLTIELSETGRSSDLHRAKRFAEQLRRGGCRVALDDFGAAFTTLSYLKQIRFDLVKIAGELIHELPNSPPDQLIVRAAAEVARGLGAQVVAKFVESAETVALLQDFGIVYGQGHFLGRPGPLPA
ncbi:MAG TPA: EAL domain-containing protein, partial [Solirubrobacteraceae bacterium]|nr:EAL domain-containing protein [Solirubrobacteraceae bacterium]